MARYAVSHPSAAAGTTLVLLNLTGTTAIRPTIYSWTLGCAATPADLAGEFTLQRTTTAGTGGTSLTPRPLDTLTVAATATAMGGTFTAAPTVTASTQLKEVGLNQRATYEWNANPGDELIVPATASNGICVYSVAHGGTPVMKTGVHYSE